MMGDVDSGAQTANPISAVLTDVDGTLVTKNKVVTERAIQAVNRLRDRGIAFTICSSRSPRGLRMLVEPLRLTMPMAAFNGGVIVLPDLSVLDERAIPDYLAPAIVDAILAYGLDVWIHSATDWYVRSREAPRVAREASTSQCEPTVWPIRRVLRRRRQDRRRQRRPRRSPRAKRRFRMRSARRCRRRSQPYYST
jgi:HAD superfamily hydrolase (TIGR01484 family)